MVDLLIKWYAIDAMFTILGYAFPSSEDDLRAFQDGASLNAEFHKNTLRTTAAQKGNQVKGLTDISFTRNSTLRLSPEVASLISFIS